MFSLIPDNVDTKLRKRHVDAKDIETINQKLAHQRELHMGKVENPVTVNDLSLDVPPEKRCS